MISLVKNMIEVKYTASNNSYHAKEPFQATRGSAGCDLFAAESKPILARSVDLLSTELKIEIPKGYYGKIHPRSSLIRNYFVTVDGGVIDSEFRGILKIIMINHLSEDFTVKLGERVAQIIFQKREDVNFVKVQESELSETSRGAGSFGSTGTQ